MAVGAMVGAAAMAAAAPADARVRESDLGLSTSGSVSVTWHGDRARGCEAAGLCGYGGSLTLHPANYGELFTGLSGNRLRYAYGELDVEDTPIVRVQRREPGATAPIEACVDSVRVNLIEVTVGGLRRARPRIGLEGGDLSPGRCAGPDLSTVLARVPRGTISLAGLRRGATTVDLSGRRRYASGRFSGTVTSTLRLHIGAAGRIRVLEESSPPPHAARGRRVRVGDLHAVYRVTGFTGQVAASFRGVGDPSLCSAADVCGTSGTANWAILTEGGTLVVDASAVVSRSARGLRGVAAGLRRGRGIVETAPDLHNTTGTTVASLARPGGVGCSDTVFAQAPELSPSEGGRITLTLGQQEGAPVEPDILRAGCPGPASSSVFGQTPIAAGAVPITAVARRRLELPLRAHGRFDDGAYRGTWRSRFALELRRVDERVSYRFERVPR